MKRNLLVTLADKNFVDQTKQLFSSVYWNAEMKIGLYNYSRKRFISIIHMKVVHSKIHQNFKQSLLKIE
jgi:hypothetical protein